MRAIRTHWGIENNLHWQLDVTFHEDGQRKRGNAARNFSLISKIAMTHLRNNPRKGSLAMKRKMAGWDIGFLKELLDAEWNMAEKTRELIISHLSNASALPITVSYTTHNCGLYNP